MQFYLQVPPTEDSTAQRGKVEKVDSRFRASEMIYGDAAYFQRLAQDEWPEFDWRIEHARTAKYVVKGAPKTASGKTR